MKAKKKKNDVIQNTETGIQFKRHFMQTSRPCNYMITDHKTISKYISKPSRKHQHSNGFWF